MSAAALAQFGTKHVAKGIGRLSTEVIESGSGSYVTMIGGRRMVRNSLLYLPVIMRIAMNQFGIGAISIHVLHV